MLVKRSGEVRVHEVSVADGLADDPADELEVGQVIWVDVAIGVGLEGHAVPGGDEQHVARMEYLPRQHGVPLASQAACSDRRQEILRQPSLEI